MDLRETLARVKPFVGPAALLITAGAWILVFQAGWQTGDWAGFWFSPSEVRGNYVDIHDKKVETPVEREKRLGLDGNHVNETLYQAKKKLLGERARTLGNDVSPGRGSVPQMYRATEREACMEMKLEYPDRYANVDCTSPDVSDNPWLGALRRRTRRTRTRTRRPGPRERRRSGLRGWRACAGARSPSPTPTRSRASARTIRALRTPAPSRRTRSRSRRRARTSTRTRPRIALPRSVRVDPADRSR